MSPSQPDLPPSAAAAAPIGALPDAVTGQFLLRHAPAAWLGYIQLARLDRPIGWWLLLLPCWWSSALASMSRHAAPDVLHLGLFLVGAVAMRGAGSTFNDIVDRDIDAQVERTRFRPLPSGRVSRHAAMIFLLVEALVGFLVLISFNRFSIALGFASLAIVGLYPFMKRVTSWPQAVLGLAFAWGGLMGWAAIYGSLAMPAYLVYCGAIAWTIGYDTIYALQDVRDDSIIGVKSTARLFGEKVVPWVTLFYAVTILCIGAAVLLSGAAGFFALAGFAGFVLHLAWQVLSLKRGLDRQPVVTALALRLFRSNREAGLILFAGLAAEALRLSLV
ncbi:MAG: 4-hydroxybenzoate octaprenyltransferase [Beijerinckiaceae bacterium]